LVVNKLHFEGFIPLVNGMAFCTRDVPSLFLIFFIGSFSTADGGRELYFPTHYFYAVKRLVNHSIKTMTVKDLDECEYRCYLDANCVSLNIRNKDPDGTHKCELNNSTHLEHDSDLKDDKLYYYRGAENHCGKPQEKCQNNATCLSGFTSKKYRCVCSPGFEGENCEDDINECDAQDNPCAAVANSVCSNTNGSYYCKCKDGFIKNDAICEVDVCHWQHYQNLTDAERKYDYVTVNGKCDNTLNGWYRFQGAAGTKMVTTCPPIHRCDANFPVWLSGGHPTVAEGEVSKKVCLRKFGKCCDYWFFIQVKNCGSYYIYNLTPQTSCPARYCSAD